MGIMEDYNIYRHRQDLSQPVSLGCLGKTSWKREAESGHQGRTG